MTVYFRQYSGFFAWLVLLAGLSGEPACSHDKKTGASVVIFGIEDKTSASIDGVAFDLKQVRNMLEGAVERSPYLTLVSGEDHGTYKAELTVVLTSERESTTPDEKGVYRAVQVDLSLTSWEAGHVEQRLSALGKAFLVQDPDRQNRQRGFNEVLENSVVRAVELVGLQIEARGMSPGELRGILNSDDEEKRLYALRSLRERHEPSLLPKVIEMLDDQAADVALEAVGVLVGERAKSAAVPLIRISRGRDRIFLLQVITALGEIGGPVARGFLFTVAAGHDSPEIRRRAAESLRHVLLGQRSGKTVALPGSGGRDDSKTAERGIR